MSNVSSTYDHLIGKRVRVYRNLHKDCYSVQDAKTRRVICHTKSLHLRDVKFIVYDKGRARVNREKRKGVHAFVVGLVCERAEIDGQQVTYNPYKNESFILLECGEPITDSKFCRLTMKAGKSVVEV